MMGDYIAVVMAKVFILVVFVMGMIGLGIELYTGSLPQTTVLKGAFNTDQSTKKEFFDNIKLQQEYSR